MLSGAHNVTEIQRDHLILGVALFVPRRGPLAGCVKDLTRLDSLDLVQDVLLLFIDGRPIPWIDKVVRILPQLVGSFVGL